MGFNLSVPAFIAPFGGGEAVLHPRGHLAIGQAAAAVGIQQMVPVAASHSLEEIAKASSVASVFSNHFRR
nr:alpha-hydroxy-acid oxidizing protein [Rhizobium sp. CFBP 13726]